MANHARAKHRASSRRPLSALIVLLALLVLGFLSPGTAFSADESAGKTQTADPDDVAKSTFLVVVTWTGYAEIPTGFTPAMDEPQEGPKGPPVPDMQETTTVQLKTEGLCTGFFTSVSGYGASAAHCFDEETTGRPGLEADLRNEMFKQAEENGSFPMMGQELPEIRDISRQIMIKQPDPDIPGAVVTDWREAALRDIRTPEVGGDHAVLKLEDAPDGIVSLQFSASGPETGDKFSAVGYPGSHIEGMNEGFNPDPDAPEVSLQDSIDNSTVRPVTTFGSSTGRQIMQGVEVYTTDTSMDPGMSGGPAVNERNEVVGVISGGYFSMGGTFNYVTKGETLRIDLEKWDGISEQAPASAGELAATQNDPALTVPQLLTAAFVGAATTLLVLLLVLLAALARQRRRTKKANKAARADADPSTATSTATAVS